MVIRWTPVLKLQAISYRSYLGHDRKIYSAHVAKNLANEDGKVQIRRVQAVEIVDDPQIKLRKTKGW